MGIKKGQKHYTKEFKEEVMRLHYKEGITLRQTSEMLGVEYKVIKNMVNRENRKKRNEALGIMSKRSGRKKKKTYENMSEIERLKAENNELKMENDILKKFQELSRGCVEE